MVQARRRRGARGVFCGLLLWGTPLGDAWTDASYDSLFRFGAPEVTNQIALILMDNDSYDHLHQDRGQLWDRALRAQLLEKTDRRRQPACGVRACSSPKTNWSAAADSKLVEAMRGEQQRVVLMADVTDGTNPRLDSASVVHPHELFLSAAAGWRRRPVWTRRRAELPATTWRRAFPRPAKAVSARSGLGGGAGGLTRLSPPMSGNNGCAIMEKTVREKSCPVFTRRSRSRVGFFRRDKIVFIAGNRPDKPSDPGSKEKDKFRTPSHRESRLAKAVGGMEIMATTFLNLVNGD